MSRREIRKEAARRFGPTGWRSALVTFVLDDGDTVNVRVGNPAWNPGGVPDADVPEASEVNYTTND